MKKIYSMMLVAAAAMAFVSCQKQENFAPEVSTEEVVLTFASEKPAFDDETKTEWTGETIQWSADDKISVAYTVDGNWQNADGNASNDAKLYKSDALEAAAVTAQFNVSTYFKGTTEGAHVFYGIYPAPSNTEFAEAPVATLTVPSIQTPGAASFDGSADLMTGVSVGEFTSRPAEGETISMKWTRLVAHANITLKALNGVTEGETVSSIKLTAQEGANLVGSQKVDIIANTVENNNSESNVLELNGGNLTIDAAGNIEFWACFLPETLTSLTVVVETNKATYTREITGISKTFKQNARNTLAIKMNEATREAKDASDYSGVYVIVAKRNSTSEYYYMINDEGTASTKRLVAVSAGDTCPEDVSSLPVSSHWEIINSNDLYTAKSVESNTYISWTSGNSACLKDAGVSFSITVKEDGTYNFEYVAADATRYLSLNGTTGNNYFAWYKTGQMADLYLIPVVPDTTPSITVEETLELTYAESEGTISVNYKNLEALEAAAYSDAECTADCDWLIASWENNAVSYVASTNEGEERTAYIQIYALDADANEYTKVITVTQKAKVDANFEAGQYWIVEPEAKLAMMPLTGNYGYPTANLAKLVDGSYKSFEANIFTIEYLEDDNCYTIKDSNDKYLYMSTNSGGSWYTSYNVSATYVSDTKYQWSISENEGKHIITNIASQYTMAYSSTHSSWGAYEDVSSYALPILVKAEDPLTVELSSISVSGHKTSFTEGDSFEFGGTVTATYTDDSTKDVTANVSVTEPNMEDGAEVTVSYTEGTVTKSFEYTISVKPAGSETTPVEYTLLFGANYNSGKVSSYTSTWTATNNGFTCTLANWNNNSNGWSYVKAGRKNYASVATITTTDAVSEALTTVTMTVDAVTTSKINSLKLYVSTDSNFSTKDTYTATAATGNVVFNITNPVANAYYRIEVDCASGSSNGLIQVSKVVYAN